MPPRKSVWEITLRIQRQSDEPERLSGLYLSETSTRRPVVVRALLWFAAATTAGLIGLLLQVLLG
jgi:hypothetical protein